MAIVTIIIAIVLEALVVDQTLSLATNLPATIKMSSNISNESRDRKTYQHSSTPLSPLHTSIAPAHIYYPIPETLF